MEERRFILWRESDRRLLVAASVLGITLGVVITIFYVVFTTIQIDGPSMSPTLLHGDRVLLTKGYPDPDAGDILSLNVPDENGRSVRVIKRVVAVGGDTVEVFGDRVYVNGDLAPHGYGEVLEHEEFYFPPFKVPEDTVYVVGDNRGVSYDSRTVGPVPISAINGRVVAIVFPLHRLGAVE
jgi:signal peptidase I